ncbi:hypothetical protein BT93_C1305 [Corymbia citriodora subsp. variegata]|nr:hypothetical protein BT93_C1305 [Corymbia citriodora subsp. variegata]
MAEVYCGYDFNLNTRNFDFFSLPIGIFNFSVGWHHLLEEVEEGNVQDISFGGYESDADQVMRGVSKCTIEKLEQKSCSPSNGDASCCICLEELNGIKKVVEIPCSHLFHCKCIIEWLKYNNSCPLCRCKVEEEE